MQKKQITALLKAVDDLHKSAEEISYNTNTLDDFIYSDEIDPKAVKRVESALGKEIKLARKALDKAEKLLNSR